MPRNTIELPYRVDYLSVLDQEGHLDQALEPDIPEELLLRIYRAMILTRRLDARMIDLQRQGRIGTFPPVTGHEATHVGAVSLLRDSDWLVPSYRELGAELWRGRQIDNVLLYWAGFEEGGIVEPRRNDLPIAVPIGTQTLHAVGLGHAIKYRKEDKIVMTFFGDGATSEGDFHEAMNFAAVFQVPVVFVCQNNQWAISVPRKRQTRSETLAQKAIAYGMPGIQADGNDVLAVYSAVKEAVDRARSGGGPTLVECVTYRLVMHTTSDDPKRYRTEEEVQSWLTRDPIPRFRDYLVRKELLTPQVIDAVEADVMAEIQTAVDRAEKRIKAGADPLQMFDHVYAQLPATLFEQREELRREMAEDQHEDRGDQDAPGPAPATVAGREIIQDLAQRAASGGFGGAQGNGRHSG
jgi:pyruvate dehydrogenase E1 component alpha subunit